MADGTAKPTDAVEIGDYAWATDPVDGRAGPRRVLDTIIGDGPKRLIDVEVGGEVITATDRHPFWVDDEGRWVDAEDLDDGDELLVADGTTVRVESLAERLAVQRVHNLTVDDIHTYHVLAGNSSVLVHNCNITPKIQGQMGSRGWTDDLIQDVRSNPSFTRSVWDLAADAPATAYARGDNYYVVVNDLTGDVIQISNRNSTTWSPVWNDPKFAPR